MNTRTLCELLLRSSQQYPDNVLVHHLDRDWTYGEILQRALSMAGWLREQGVCEGQRVGLLAANSAPYVVSYFGILLAGGIVVALNPDTTPRELSHTLAHCQPTVVITAGKCEEHLDVIAERLSSVRAVVRLAQQPSSFGGLGRQVAQFSEVVRHRPLEPSTCRAGSSQIAQIIYTSGTTGRPKGVTLSHRNLSANCLSILEYLELGSSDSVFAVLPFFYSYGNSLLLTHAAVGGRLVLASNFVFWQQALNLMESQRATGFSGVPSTYAMLLAKSNFTKREFPHLRYLTCAGGALAPAVVERIRRSLPHVGIFPMYGQTEAAARLSTLLPHELDRKPGSIGKGIPGVQLEVLDGHGRPVPVGEVGEIIARGENLMVGYWEDPEATARVLRPEGLRTGDLARVDEDGYIYIVGRRDDIIKSGAYRIHPQEIEEVVLELRGVSEAAVVGHPDEIQGEIVVAFVVPADGGQGVSEEAVAAHCKGSLPAHKQPRRVYLVEALPKTSSNKVKRTELRQRGTVVS